MNEDSPIRAIDLCEKRIRKHFPRAYPEPLSREQGSKNLQIGLSGGPEHLLYLCGKARVLASEDKVTEAMLWLTFIEGAMWAYGIVSLREMERWNDPPTFPSGTFQ